MIKNIDVRFYTIAEQYSEYHGEDMPDLCEITETCFLELSSLKGSTIAYERSTIWQNGTSHIAMTVTCQDTPDHADLETI